MGASNSRSKKMGGETWVLQTLDLRNWALLKEMLPVVIFFYI